jgi:nucleotide-binding universal stress UspA family protein
MSLLAAIDTDRGAEAVVTTGQELATALGEELVVLHVVPESEDSDRRRDRIEGVVVDALGDADGVDLRIVDQPAGRDVPLGRTATGILDVADEVDASYIVVGSRKRTPIGKVMLGSVAQLVLINAEVPVVTVEQ